MGLITLVAGNCKTRCFVTSIMGTAATLTQERWAHRHPVVAYFLLTYAISWTAALVVISPHLLRHQSLTRLDGILMFPAMLLGPPIASAMLTRLLDGKAGLRTLYARMRRMAFASRWWAALVIPPALVLGILFCLMSFDSSVYRPGLFIGGIGFGLVAGFIEEIGWTGFAYPHMARGGHPFRSAAVLGLLWGLWHLPVINFLGTASPHGSAWPEFAAAFIIAMAGLRILIAWLYLATRSIPIAQLMHAASTSSLVIFSPAGVSPGQEAFWYALYAAALWLAALMVYRSFRGRPKTRPQIAT